MPVTIRDSIYSGIAEQFPDIYKEQGDFLVEFIQAYYQHNDEKMDRDIPKLKDIDTTLTAFLVYYKKKYLADLPLDTTLDTRFIIKHIQDMYKRKGTQESLELLFKLFFDQDIEVFYPSTALLRPSDSIWGGDVYLEMLPVYAVDDYPISRGDRIRGDISLASAFVDEVLFVNFSGSLTPILYLSNIAGSFSADDSIEIVLTSSSGIETATNVGKLISGSINQINVSTFNRVANQKVGDKVKLKSSINGIDGEGRVSRTSQTETGTIDFTITDGGFGYVDPTSITASNDVGVSNQVLIIDSANVPSSANYVDIQKGDVLVTAGSQITYDGSTTVTNVTTQLVQGQKYRIISKGNTTDTEWTNLGADGSPSEGEVFVASGAAFMADGTSALSGVGNGTVGPEQFTINGSVRVIEYRHPLVFVESNTAQEVYDFGYISIPNGGGNVLAQSIANLVTPNTHVIPQEFAHYARNLNKPSSFTNNSIVGDLSSSNGADSIDTEIISDYLVALASTDYTSFGANQKLPGIVPSLSGAYYGSYLYGVYSAFSKFGIYTGFQATARPSKAHLLLSTQTSLGGQAGTAIDFPTTITNPSFTVWRIRGEERLGAGDLANYQVAIKSVGSINDSAKFDIGSLTNVETVSLITDQIGDFLTTVIDPNNNSQGDVGEDYGMSGPGEENYDTTLADAFSSITLKIGTIDSLNITSSGQNYQNDVKTLLIHDNIAKFNKKDIIMTFETVDFFLNAGDIITQARTIPDVDINQAGNINEASLDALGASTAGSGYTQSATTFDFTAGGTIAYTAKAKFLKREGNNFYFRPLSFHGFDESLPVKISSIDKSFQSIVPDTTSQSMGANAEIEGTASFQTGQIEEVSVVKTGYRYTDNEVVEIINLESTSAYYNQSVATANIRALGQGKTEGQWKSKTSFISDKSKRLHDNDYYQEYSYDVSSIVDPSVYTPLIDETVGVAGTKLFSTPLINSNNDLDSSLDVEFTFFLTTLDQYVTTDGDNYTAENGDLLQAQTSGVFTP